MTPFISRTSFRSLLWCAAAVMGSGALAQTTQSPRATARKLDIYVSETKTLEFDKRVEDPPDTGNDIIDVQRVKNTDNQLSVKGIAAGSTSMSFTSGGRQYQYNVTVSPMPERLYINLAESKRLVFTDDVDDYSLSVNKIVKVIQPNPKTILLEAVIPGKTTVTIYTKAGEIYRYFVSTFENRGADLLEIQNQFAAKGYRSLTITFDKDQAVIGGSVPTQEELDDAVRIVKQYTPYVIVKASLAQAAEYSEFSEEESVIINSIQRIAQVKGLIVKVRFPNPVVTEVSSTIRQVGDYITPGQTTIANGVSVTTRAAFDKPDPNQGQGPTELRPLENSSVTRTVTKDLTVPEKIFLYGQVDNDIEEARAIRVARTFCPVVVSFITVKDPIQIRIKFRVFQVNITKLKDVGVKWDSLGGDGPHIDLNFGNSVNPLNMFQTITQTINNGGSVVTAMQSFFQYGFNANVDATAQLRLLEQLNCVKTGKESDIFVTNGQPGFFSDGEVIPYLGQAQTNVSAGVVTTSATVFFQFVGLNIDMVPLGIQQSGGNTPQGEKVSGLSSAANTGGYTVTDFTDPTANKYSTAPSLQHHGDINLPAPYIDDSVKYVDENGLIGLNISSQLTALNGPLQNVTAAGIGVNGNNVVLQAPDFFVRATRTRCHLRDGESIVLNGLIDDLTAKEISQVPFLAKIPFFGNLFKNPVDTDNRREVMVLITPQIIRLRDPDSKRIPKPKLPETQDYVTKETDDIVPTVKPIRYNPSEIDLRGINNAGETANASEIQVEEGPKKRKPPKPAKTHVTISTERAASQPKPAPASQPAPQPETPKSAPAPVIDSSAPPITPASEPAAPPTVPAPPPTPTAPPAPTEPRASAPTIDTTPSAANGSANQGTKKSSQGKNEATDTLP